MEDNKTLACEMFDNAKKKCLEDNHNYLQKLIDLLLILIEKEALEGKLELNYKLNNSLNIIIKDYIQNHFRKLGFGIYVSISDSEIDITWHWPLTKTGVRYIE